MKSILFISLGTLVWMLTCAANIHAEIQPVTGKSIPIYNNLPEGRGISLTICCNYDYKREPIQNEPEPGKSFSYPEQSFNQVIYASPNTKFDFAAVTRINGAPVEEIFTYTCEKTDSPGCDVQWLTRAYTPIKKLSIKLLCDGQKPTNYTGKADGQIQFGFVRGSLRLQDVPGTHDCERSDVAKKESGQRKRRQTDDQQAN